MGQDEERSSLLLTWSTPGQSAVICSELSSCSACQPEGNSDFPHGFERVKSSTEGAGWWLDVLAPKTRKKQEHGLEVRKLSSGACDGHTAKQSWGSWLTHHHSAPAGMRLLKPKLQLGSGSLLLPLNGNQYVSPCRRRLLAEPGCQPCQQPARAHQLTSFCSLSPSSLLPPRTSLPLEKPPPLEDSSPRSEAAQK